MLDSDARDMPDGQPVFARRAAWRHLDADLEALTRAQLACWIAYSPVRALRWRLMPRGVHDYPPFGRPGRLRYWFQTHL